MEAAVSLPDPLFKAADELARQRGVSPNDLIVEALAAYLRSHHDAEITARLNEVYRQEDSSLDPVIATIQAASLPRDEW